MTRHILYQAQGISAPLKAALKTDASLNEAPLIDSYGRGVSYLRLSVTDRCDLRCTYCMAETMEFLPKKDLLTLEELDRLASTFIARGVRKLRLTGGEPLVRRGIMGLINSLSRHIESGALDELTLTTNGTQLSKYAEDLYAAGMRRINVSVDSFDPGTFARITRGGDLARVMDGIKAAQEAGLRVKINSVALAQDNASDMASMIEFVHSQNMDMTLIEAMPLGDVSEDRFDQYVSLRDLSAVLTPALGLTPLALKTGGPARYYLSEKTGGQLGFITPLSHNFCESCNRVRLTCTGQLYMCLGQEGRVDLRAILRAGGDADGALNAALDQAMRDKAKGHDFVIERAGQAPALARHMSVTGG